MEIRFLAEYLVDEEGEILNIPYGDLEKACLESSYENVAIIKIVTEGVETLTKRKLIINSQTRKSSLFSRLEKAINGDRRYQEKKAESIALHVKAREEEKKQISKKEYMLYLKEKLFLKKEFLKGIGIETRDRKLLSSTFETADDKNRQFFYAK